MLAPKIYDDFLKREKRLWIILITFSVGFIMAITFIGIMVFSLIHEKTKILAYTSTGIPKFVEYRSGGHEVVEVQSFVLSAIVKIFQFSYGDFLTNSPYDVYSKSGVRDYFTPDYFNDFVTGLTTSGYIKQLVSRRAIVIITTQPSIEVQTDATTGTILAKVVLNRTERSARGEDNTQQPVLVTMQSGSRTITNPWGLYITRIQFYAQQQKAK